LQVDDDESKKGNSKAYLLIKSLRARKMKLEKEI
jgi:hypothetical protein